MKTSKLIYLYGKTVDVIEKVIISILGISSIVLISLVYLHINYLIAGCVFLIFTLVLIMARLSRPYYIVFSDNIIKVLNGLKRVKKEKPLNELIEVSILRLRTGGRNMDDFYCMVFSENNSLNSSNRVEELIQDENLFLFVYSKRNTMILEEFTNILINDKR